MRVKKLRLEIDQIDQKLVALLSERAKRALQIKQEKEKGGEPLFVPSRELAVLQGILRHNRGPLSELALRQIYREILSACRSLQGELQVAFLGPKATFTHQAALSLFGASATYQPEPSIEQVFRSVDTGEVAYGVVPIENSTEGAVSHTLDNFLTHDVQICAEILMAVSHSLLSQVPRKEVTVVYSNPQALAQCRKALARLLPKARQVETSSTSAAAERAAKERRAAAVASPLSAKVYGLKVLRRHLEDLPQNRTRFLTLGKRAPEPVGKGKTSILFSVPHRSGSLLQALEPLRRHRVNMTMIESRPARVKLWEYLFFVDLAGYASVPKVKRALQEMESKTTFLKLLGSYPEASAE